MKHLEDELTYGTRLLHVGVIVAWRSIERRYRGTGAWGRDERVYRMLRQAEAAASAGCFDAVGELADKIIDNLVAQGVAVDMRITQEGMSPWP